MLISGSPDKPPISFLFFPTKFSLFLSVVLEIIIPLILNFLINSIMWFILVSSISGETFKTKGF